MKRFLTALVLSAGLAAPAMAEIKGKVTFDGQAPERKPLAGISQDPNCGKLHKTPVLDETVIVGKGGELANAVVYLKGDLKGEAPADEAVLDQSGCQYVPHVIDVTVGQKLVAQNSDPFLHNVHTLPENNPPMNRGQAVKGQKDPIPTKSEEVFKVKCDVHPWMSAWICIFDHPFHSTTLEDGTFAIPTKGLKDGEYEVVVWHEKFKECATGKVTVKDGVGKIDLKAKPKAAMVGADTEKVITVLNNDGKPTCCTDGSKCGKKVEATATK
jgi:plastocyanin